MMEVCQKLCILPQMEHCSPPFIMKERFSRVQYPTVQWLQWGVINLQTVYLA